MSDTAAVAACTASEALVCGSLPDSGVLSLGRSTSTSPSQNVMRSRNHILRLLVCFSLRLRHCGRTHSRLTVPDKSQVFALRLTARKFAKNAAKRIRRKFSIEDRKSVVQGKSVELGGRGIVKKKKRRKDKRTAQHRASYK